MCVLAIIKGMKGEDWSMRDLLPKAMKAGAISSVVSFPNNVLQYAGFKSGLGDLAANTTTTEAAILALLRAFHPKSRKAKS